MKIETITNNVNNTNMVGHPIEKRRITPVETSDTVSIGIKQEPNEVLKIESPPYFPLGDTQAIYKKR